MTEIELGGNVPASERALHVELGRPHVPEGLAALAALPLGRGHRRIVRCAGPRFAAASRRTVTIGGAASVLDTLRLPGRGGADVEVRLQHNAQAFFQANRYLLAQLAARVVSLVPAGPAVNIYAGVGLFSASLAASGWTSVTGVEGDRAGAVDLRANASPFGPALVPVEMAVEAYLATHPTTAETTVIVNPPRTGMSREVSAAIAAQKARTVIYVSCDVATFARDARKLVDAGYRLSHLEAF